MDSVWGCPAVDIASKGAARSNSGSQPQAMKSGQVRTSILQCGQFASCSPAAGRGTWRDCTVAKQDAFATRPAARLRPYRGFHPYNFNALQLCAIALPRRNPFSYSFAAEQQVQPSDPHIGPFSSARCSRCSTAGAARQLQRQTAERRQLRACSCLTMPVTSSSSCTPAGPLEPCICSPAWGRPLSTAVRDACSWHGRHARCVRGRAAVLALLLFGCLECGVLRPASGNCNHNMLCICQA